MLLLNLTFTLKSTTEEDKKNSTTSLFQELTVPSSVAIFQHHQYMEFTFHNSYVIVPSTVNFWTDLRCWRKSYSNKATLLQGWSDRKQIILSSSQSGWPLKNIHISNDNGYFTFYVDVFFALSLPRLLQDLTVYTIDLIRFFGVLTPLSTIFQQYHGDQF